MCRLGASPEQATWFYPIQEEVGQPGKDFRSKFARDRDRIFFSKSFRRLSKKTQVYLASQGNQHLRTRLTHTLEVTQIARGIARTLRVSEDLTEAMALGHDLGHAPFGHAGEAQLNEIMRGRIPLPRRVARRMGAAGAGRDHGEFKHNFQSVRLVTFLEEYEDGHEGLNLTQECLEGILKHTDLRCDDSEGELCVYPYRRDGEGAGEGGLWGALYGGCCWCRSVEGQIVAFADEIAQVAHDLSDAVELDVLPLEKLVKVDAVASAVRAARKRGRKIDVGDLEEIRPPKRNVVSAQVTSAIIAYFVGGTASAMAKRMKGMPSRESLKEARVLAGVEPGRRFRRLKEFKDNLVVNNFDVNRMDNKGAYLIRRLADAYISDPRQLPDTVLWRYLKAKKLDLANLRKEGFVGWLRKARTIYDIRDALDEGDEQGVVEFVGKVGEGREFRLRPSRLLDKSSVYMAVDADYSRAVVDYIAGMTDEFAADEVERLYH